jgi:bifunctional DNA-binding transcriptional regulator/antitoxin component of YhaV-PrlF toxin-antitoxin module
MLIEMKSRSQATLPVEIVKKLGVGAGDKFRVVERDGGVFLCPVVVYPKAKTEEIAKAVRDNKKNPSARTSYPFYDQEDAETLFYI